MKNKLCSIRLKLSLLTLHCGGRSVARAHLSILSTIPLKRYQQLVALAKERNGNYPIFILYPDGTPQELIPSPALNTSLGSKFPRLHKACRLNKVSCSHFSSRLTSVTPKHLLVGILFRDQSLKIHQILSGVTEVVRGVQYHLYFSRDATIWDTLIFVWHIFPF